MTRYVYMESSPQLKGKARDFGAGYRRMAVVELEDGFEGLPAMISERAKGVRRIVREVTAHIGKTPRSFGRQQQEELRALAKQLNE